MTTLPSGVRVERVPVARTYPLRALVLRPHAPEHVRLPADDRPDTAAFAALDGDEVVGTAVAFPEACPWRPAVAGAWRLRGMATAPDRQATGVGGAVLAAVLDHVAAAGGTLVWCNARTTARRFYERAGFQAHGEEWVDPDIGPHVAMWRPVGPASPRGRTAAGAG
ncbi:MAG TPA: GNAT family N-acetyltransferase [Acidimicrobiales bacterium]|nr:GNAT family N-acetyltransferase [Acidimicrobiales bacterium]